MVGGGGCGVMVVRAHFNGITFTHGPAGFPTLSSLRSPDRGLLQIGIHSVIAYVGNTIHPVKSASSLSETAGKSAAEQFRIVCKLCSIRCLLRASVRCAIRL